MRIAMVTEGTYPYGHGGVAVWCDQVVRGMPEHEFDLLAITGSGGEKLAWPLPGNVGQVTSLPLWGAPPERTKHHAPRRSKAQGDLGEISEAFGASLVQPDLERSRRDFTAALRAWALVAPERDVEGAFISPRTVELLMDSWSQDLLAVKWGGRSRGVPTVADAVTATRLIAHALRPLAAVPRRVDLAHLVANGLAGMLGLSLKWRYNAPYVLSEHGVYLRERYLSFGGSGYTWPVKWLMLRFYRLLCGTVYSQAALVAPGNIYNRRWERWDGVPDEVIRTVYNGVDPSEFAVANDEPLTPTIAFVGRVDPIKDIETLVRAFALVHQQMPQARLRIFGGTAAGGEAYRDKMIALAAELGIGEAAVFEGRVERIQDAYAAGNVIALTSISEGFPYTVIEAMSSGRATVSTDVGGVAEAVGEAGLIVPPRDPQAVADACLVLLRDSEQRARMAALARQRVIGMFTLERSLGAFRELYEEVVQGYQDVTS